VVPSPSAEKGLWFYASFAHLLFGTLLLSPFFTKPADAVSDAVIAALVLPEIHAVVLTLGAGWALYAWKSIFAYYVTVIIVGSLAMVMRGTRSTWGKQLTDSFYVVSTHLGEAQVVFSLLFLFALLAFHLDNMREFLTLAATCVIIVPLRLFEHVALIGKHLEEIWSESAIYENLGEPYARKEPNLILLRRTAEGTLRFGQVLTMKHSAQDALHHAMINRRIPTR
jgi:uncharacterized protein